MTNAEPYSELVAAVVRERLAEIIRQADQTSETPSPHDGPHRHGTAGWPARSDQEPGWHPAVTAHEEAGPSHQPWRHMRLTGVLAAADLVLIVFTERREPSQVFIHSEDVARYRDLPMDAEQAGRLIITHLDERMGGTGWQQNAPSQRIGHLVILT